MATRVFDEEELELQNGEKVLIRPLNIKRLRKFMDIVKGFDQIEDEMERMDAMFRASAIAIGQKRPDLEANMDALEDALDVPTMWRIFEIAAGIKLSDPNVQAAAEALLGKN